MWYSVVYPVYTRQMIHCVSDTTVQNKPNMTFSSRGAFLVEGWTEIELKVCNHHDNSFDITDGHPSDSHSSDVLNPREKENLPSCHQLPAVHVDDTFSVVMTSSSVHSTHFCNYSIIKEGHWKVVFLMRNTWTFCGYSNVWTIWLSVHALEKTLQVITIYLLTQTCLPTESGQFDRFCGICLIANC